MTPILDLEKDVPSVPARKAKIRIGLALLVGAAIGRAGDLSPVSMPDLPPSNWLFAIMGIWIAIAFHEAGHLLAGRAVGFGFGGVSIGGIVMLRSGNRWVVRFDPRLLFAGFARPLPKTGDYRRADFAWTVAAGPIAGFALAAAGTAMLMRFGNGKWDWIASFFWAFNGLALVALLPSSKGINRTDISRLWQIMREPESAKAWMAVLAIQTADAKGVLPRDWDAEVFRLTIAGNGSNSENSFNNLMAYYRRIDEGDVDLALGHLESCLAQRRDWARGFGAPFFWRRPPHALCFATTPGTPANGWSGRGRKGSLKPPVPLKALLRCGSAALRTRCGI